MAIKIYEQFAPFANPADGDYPYGSIKNDSIPGAEDGTPLDAVWANDYAGSDAELFAQANIVPNGQPDKKGASQRVDAIKLLEKEASKITNADGGSVQDFIDAQYTTVAELATGKFHVGQYVRLIDRAIGLFLLQSGGIADGYGILDAGNGNTAVLQHNNVISALEFGVKAGVDSTAAVKALMSYAQGLSSVSTGFPFTAMRPKVNFSPDEYIISGDNPLGVQTLGASVSYEVDLRGARLTWNVENEDDTLFKNMGTSYNVIIKDGSIRYTMQGSDNVKGYFLTSNSIGATAIMSKNIIANIIVTKSESNHLKGIFHLDGTTHCDQSEVVNCGFIGWQTFYYSENPEAVDWSFTNTSMYPDVNQFTHFHHHNQWSGGMRIIGCELGTRTNGTFFKATSDSPVTSANNGYIYCNSRMETGSGSNVDLLDVNHGRYELRGMNYFAGGGAATGAAVLLKGSAEVELHKCIIPNRFIIEAQTISEWDSTHSGGVNGIQLLLSDCVFSQSIYKPEYVTTSGVPKTAREVVANDLITPIVRINDLSSMCGTYGTGRGGFNIQKNVYNYSAIRQGGGVKQILYYNDYLQMPGDILVTSLKVAHTTVLPGNFLKIGVFVQGASTPIFSVPINPNTPQYNVEMITTDIGLSIPVQTGAGTRLQFKFLDDSGNIVSGDNVPGYAVVEFEPLTAWHQFPAGLDIELL